MDLKYRIQSCDAYFRVHETKKWTCSKPPFDLFNHAALHSVKPSCEGKLNLKEIKLYKEAPFKIFHFFLGRT